MDMIKNKPRGFPSGSQLKNPSANAGDMGLIPGPGRPHMSCREQVNPYTSTIEPVLLSPRILTTEAHVPRAHASQEKPLQ